MVNTKADDKSLKILFHIFYKYHIYHIVYYTFIKLAEALINTKLLIKHIFEKIVESKLPGLEENLSQEINNDLRLVIK